MSRFQRLLKYFSTESGRQTAFYCVSAVGIGVFVSRWAPHSLGINYYREFATCYNNGVEKQLNNKVHARFEKALNMVKDMEELERSRYKMFCVYGMEPWHAGSYHSVFGAVIGIPANFEYEKPSDIPELKIIENNQPVPWNTEIRKQLEEALILTENEQIFAMLKEIIACRSWQWPLNCFYSTVWVLSTYAMAFALNEKLNLRQRPFSLRLVMYTLVVLFTIGNFCFATDATQMYYDTTIDKQIAALGKEMIEAGIGYYDKVLKRNMAVRNFTGDYSMYSSSGNVNMFLRQKTMPFTARKEFFEKQLKQLVTENEAETLETS